jgi:hypothetical protein
MYMSTECDVSWKGRLWCRRSNGDHVWMIHTIPGSRRRRRLARKRLHDSEHVEYRLS